MFVVDGGIGELEGLGDTDYRGEHIGARLHLHLTVDAFHPFGQIVSIISRGDEVSGFLAPPVSAVGGKACRQDGGAVLERDAERP